MQPKISFLPKFLFPRSKKNRYNILSLTYNHKIEKIRRIKIPLDVFSYNKALNNISGNRNLFYLIFENEETQKINVLFKISRNLIGSYEF